jgi:carbon storage regulator
MLVLSRKIGEKIHVGNDVTIEVRRVAGNRVILAIDAPRTTRILRGELRQACLEIEAEEAILKELRHVEGHASPASGG